MGFFKVKSITDLSKASVGDRIETSDFSTLITNKDFLQMEYTDEQEDRVKYIVNSGIFAVTKTAEGLKLFPTSFSKDNILKLKNSASLISDQVRKFFAKKDVYLKWGKAVPKRGWLLWGSPGQGKSLHIAEIAEELVKDQKTAVILWPSDQIDAGDVKEFVKNFDYNAVERLLLIIEDLGGVEQEQIRIRSLASLLALLDNTEKAFSIPTAIIATTNFPESFMGNIANRPGRFDVKVEIKPPSASERVEFLKFFTADAAPDELIQEIQKKIYSDLSPAHIKEIIMRSELNDISLIESLQEIQREVEVYKKFFETNKNKLGIIQDDQY